MAVIDEMWKCGESTQGELNREHERKRRRDRTHSKRHPLTPAHSDVHFQQLRTPEAAEAMLDRMSGSKSASVLCLNDDIERNYTQVREIVGDWFEKMWPEKAVWER